MNRLAFSAVLLLAAAPAAAAERSYTITSFDRIRVEGPFAVTVTSNRGPAARASGTAAALDEVVARVDGRTLVLRRGTGGWGGYPGGQRGPVSIAVSVPQLASASLTGAGSLTIDAMRGQRLDLVVDGSGALRVGRIETDRLTATVVGAGAMALGGQAAEARIIVRGSGGLDAPQLSVADANVTADGAGSVRLAARRTANVQASGGGSVLVSGSPACTVRNSGAGEVTCGAGRR